MTTTNRTVAVGVFRDPDRAREAIGALKDAGFQGDDISLLMPDRQQARDMAEETGTRAGEGAATGLVAGGILGGLGGFLVGIGALAIPGVGPFIAAGALATTLGGAAVGAGVGVVAGALIGMGIPKEEAEYYEGEVRSGRTLVAVKAGSRMSEADSILHDYDAYDVEHRDRTPAGAGDTRTTSSTATRRTTADTTDRQSVQLHEEELRVQKRPVETGNVTLGKDVVEEQRTMDVPVTREEVTVDRRPVEPRPSDRAIDDRDRTVDVPVRGARRRREAPRVYEEASVGKRSVTDTQSVSETVRREEPRVERQGDVRVQGWNEAMPTYRQRWQQQYGASGGRWDDYEPSYRYGYEMHSRPEYSGRSFNDAEPNLRSDWEQRYPNSPWDRAREGIRATWDDATA